MSAASDELSGLPNASSQRLSHATSQIAVPAPLNRSSNKSHFGKQGSLHHGASVESVPPRTTHTHTHTRTRARTRTRTRSRRNLTSTGPLQQRLIYIESKWMSTQTSPGSKRTFASTREDGNLLDEPRKRLPPLAFRTRMLGQGASRIHEILVLTGPQHKHTHTHTRTCRLSKALKLCLYNLLETQNNQQTQKLKERLTVTMIGEYSIFLGC